MGAGAIREGLSEEMILEPRPEWQEGTGHGKISIIGVHSQLLAGILKGALLLSGPFPGNTLVSLATRSPASKVLPRDQGLAWDAPDYYPRPRSHHPTLPGSALGGRGAKMSALQKCGHQSPSLPPALMQAATHPWITAFQGFMAEQVKKKC